MAEILIGPHKGQIGRVVKAEFDAGARYGWYTLDMPDGTKLMYAGEEIRLFAK
jgi:hypothetical protein